MNTKVTICVGLNDKDSKHQEITTDAAKALIFQNVVAFFGFGTISDASGVYTHGDGQAAGVANPLKFSVMIIDLILDRKAGEAYNPSDFYFHVLDYRDIWPEISDRITKAMDEKPEQVVKFELCRYVIENGYNPEICDYINSVDWL